MTGSKNGSTNETPTAPFSLTFHAEDLSGLAAAEGAVVAFFSGGGEAGASLSPAAAACDTATEGQVRRALARVGAGVGETVTLTAPHGLAADALILVGLGDAPLTRTTARRAGAAAAKAVAAAKAAEAVVRLEGVGGDAGDADMAAEVLYGLRLRAYRFVRRKSQTDDRAFSAARAAGTQAGDAEAAFAARSALADGVVFTRDLVNEPANYLTPETFADEAAALADDGLEVEILDEAALEKLGMRALLGVGRGSARKSAVAVIQWRGAPESVAEPIAFVGKGVCFDTGGISLKPPAGMEEMTMDMGGAGVVAGVMKALARRKAPVNVVGLLGLVENMPDADAQRPGDVVTAMSGKTIEIINTDAEGRLVLADVLWYAQERFKPRCVVNLATLTGAIIIALGHENAGLFANDDALAEALLAAAQEEGEGLWRMPLGPAYDKALKSRIADVKNTGGRPAGSITAAQFLQRFIKDGQAWAHIDIAGVALTKEEGATWPKGASGWGVASLVRLAESYGDG